MQFSIGTAFDILPTKLNYIMTLKTINSHSEMLDALMPEEKNYILLYKKGSETSDCSFESLSHAIEEMSDINVLTVDVNIVRDIHPKYNITSAPSLMIFEGQDYIKTVKGCNDKDFYISLFESSLYKSVNTENESPQKRVIVYGTPSCSWCTTIKNHFNKNGIKFSYIDVSQDTKAAEAMVKRSGQQGVPQTEIGNEMIVGFDKKKINTLLNIK